MRIRFDSMWRAMPALGLLAAGICLPAAAADITVLSAAAVQAPMTDLAEQFKHATGHHVHFEFSTAGGVDGRVKAGARPDLVINARERLDALAHAKLIAPAPARNLGVVQIGLAARKGTPKPDISTVDAFRATLLKAQSVAYGDPAKGPTTGIHTAAVIERLGLADALKGKTQLAPNGLEVMKLVASGKAEFGITQISEIKHIQGDTLIGPLPAELQLNTTYSVAFGHEAGAAPGASVLAARQFADLLLSASGREHFTRAGFQ